jgi:hypothetical protein
MGDMEVIGADGTRATFTDDGIKFDEIPNSERCDACNDPRISRLDGIATCLGCGCVNVIKFHRDELGV